MTENRSSYAAAANRRSASIRGAIVGAAAADALGWPTEFVRDRDHLTALYGSVMVSEYQSWHKIAGGRFYGYREDIGPGEYSDDTQLSLAVARSLRADGSLNPVQFAEIELPSWLGYARGAGTTITQAARALRRANAAWDRNIFSYTRRRQQVSSWEAGANGVAMRVAPIALANLNNPTQLEGAVWACAIATHGHPRAILGAILYAEALRRVASAPHRPLPALVADLGYDMTNRHVPGQAELQGWIALRPGGAKAFAVDWTDAIEEIRSGIDLILSTVPGEETSVLHSLGCYEPETRGSGVTTVLAGLLLAISAQDDFERAVVRAVNQLGTDTDTIAGFVGGLLGARLGYAAIPSRWLGQLQDRAYLFRVAEEVAAISEGYGAGGHALLPVRDAEQAARPTVLDLLKAGHTTEGQEAYYPVLGRGIVQSLDVQPVRRTGYEVRFAWVDFDIGQSCRFRVITPAH